MAQTEAVDLLALHLEAKKRGGRALALPRVLRDGVTLVWSADRSGLILTTVTGFVSAGLAGVQVLLGKRVLDAFVLADQSGGTARSAYPPLIALAVITATIGLLSAIQIQRLRVLGELAQRETWSKVVDVTSRVDLMTFEDSTFFDQLQRVETQAVLRPVQVCQALSGLVSGLVGVVGLVAVLVVISPILVPLMLLTGLPLLAVQRVQSRFEYTFAVRETPPFRRRQYLRDVLVLRETSRELRAFNLGPAIRQRYEQEYDRFVGALRRHVRAKLLVILAGTVLSAVLTAISLVVLVALVAHKDLSLAQAGAAALAIRLLVGRLQQLASSIGILFESALFLEDLAAFLARQGPRGDQVEEGLSAEPFRELRLNGVSFSYPGSTVRAVAEVDLKFRSGEVIALVGENGSGKSTLAKLISGLYEPTEGSITWNGTDLRALRPSSLREQVAMIFQDFVRYQFSAADNIAVGRSAAMSDRAAVEEAARLADADRLLMALPEGYDTVLSKQFAGGVDLSLGQWQRVALARAFFRDAPVVILDEPSSALDPRAESDLFARIRQLLGNRTIVLISHRYSSVRAADRIIVLDQGRIVEQGDHEELIAKEGLYAELFELQVAAYLGGSSDPARP